MELRIDLSPEIEAKLRSRARTLGRDVTDLIAEAIEEKLSVVSQDSSHLSAEQWCSEWRVWAASHRTLDHVVDDSRETIYAGRGE